MAGKEMREYERIIFTWSDSRNGGALELMQESINGLALLSRHPPRRLGNLDEEDKQANDEALQDG